MMLLAYGADPNATDSASMSPLAHVVEVHRCGGACRGHFTDRLPPTLLAHKDSVFGARAQLIGYNAQTLETFLRAQFGENKKKGRTFTWKHQFVCYRYICWPKTSPTGQISQLDFGAQRIRPVQH
ncbi:hypothetical protein niasHT_025981 [Heterodera trifolii]|uniref:Uncharacterized protein n=1 Tax=Heterodera trifolii TaxID=157864 RepID=A0ABD2JAE5_9BILA